MEEEHNFVNNVYVDAFSDYELKSSEFNNDSDTGSDSNEVQFKQRTIRIIRTDDESDSSTDIILYDNIFYIHTDINSTSVFK